MRAIASIKWGSTVVPAARVTILADRKPYPVIMIKRDKRSELPCDSIHSQGGQFIHSQGASY